MFTQNLKGFSNLAGKVTSVFRKGDAKEGQAEGQDQGQDEEFTHVMDQALMTSCTRAIKVQSLVRNLQTVSHNLCMNQPISSIVTHNYGHH